MNNEIHELAALTQALQQTLIRKRRLGQRRWNPGPKMAPDLPARSSAAAAEAPMAAAPGVAQPASTVSQSAEAAACINMEQLRLAAGRCQACSLHRGRHQPVFSDGDPGPGAILFLGEAPSEDDNRSGTPFSGPPGQLLTDIIEKGMGLDRRKVTITHLVKCPTPGGRAPSDSEIGLCAPWLQRQLELAAPSVLVPLGQVPSNFLVGSKARLEDQREQVFERLGRPVVPTFGPQQLLQDPALKRPCWADIQRAMAVAGLQKPS